MLAERDRNSTAIASVSAYIDRFLERGGSNQQIASGQQMVFLTERSEQVFQKPSASGVAYPSENVVFVENNFGYSTAALSHEILHRVLEEEDHDKGCFVDMVHENQLKYELTQVGDNKCPVIKKFDC
jgi:hypothetical protein